MFSVTCTVLAGSQNLAEVTQLALAEMVTLPAPRTGFLPPVSEPNCLPVERVPVVDGRLSGSRCGGGVGRGLQLLMHAVGIPDIDHHAAHDHQQQHEHHDQRQRLAAFV